MMPQPPSDYMAQALSYRIIRETEIMFRDYHAFIADRRPEMAEKRFRSWEDEVFRACHEMNRASAETIQRLQAEVGRLYAMVPMPSYAIWPKPEPAPPAAAPIKCPRGEEISEAFMEGMVPTKPSTVDFGIVIQEPAPAAEPEPKCSCPAGGVNDLCEIHGKDVPF